MFLKVAVLSLDGYVLKFTGIRHYMIKSTDTVQSLIDQISYGGSIRVYYRSYELASSAKVLIDIWRITLQPAFTDFAFFCAHVTPLMSMSNPGTNYFMISPL